MRINAASVNVCTEVSEQGMQVSWNGYHISEKTEEPKVSQVRESLFSQGIVCSDSGDNEVHGGVSFSGSADTGGNANAGVDVHVESGGGDVSASIGGSVSRDKEGNTSGEVRGSVDIRY